MNKIPVRKISSAEQSPDVAERFSIRTLTQLMDGQDLYQELHRHDFFFVLALAKGNGLHTIDFVPYQIVDHAIFFMRPGQVHQLDLKHGSTGFLMEFNTSFYHPTDKSAVHRLRKASSKNFCQLDIDRFEKLLAILNYISNEYTGKQDGYEEIIRSNLHIFFIEFTRQSQHPGKISTTVHPYTQERFEEFLLLLDSRILQQKQVGYYTEQMNLSAYQLNEIIKTAIGKTTSEIINETILLEAKRLLLATPGQIKEIADQLGYEDASYFTRFLGNIPANHPNHSGCIQIPVNINQPALVLPAGWALFYSFENNRQIVESCWRTGSLSCFNKRGR